jgi:hypothetical protein
MLCLAMLSWGGCAVGGGEADLTTFEGVLAEARAADYWALDKLEDGSVTYDELEWAEDQWARCVEGLGLNLTASEPFRNPVDGTLAGLLWDWNGQDPKPDPDQAEFGEKVNGCYDHYDLELLTWGYTASTGGVMDEPLRQYVLECLNELGLAPAPEFRSLAELVEDPAIGLERGSVVMNCAEAGVGELYPEVPYFGGSYRRPCDGSPA